MRRIILILPVMFLFVVPHLAAQERSDFEIYLSEVGGSAPFLSGREAFKYQMIYNGTYFWSSPEFKKGDLMYNGKLYYGLDMNIDAFVQDLLVRMPDGVVSIRLDRDHVQWFTLGDVRFVNLVAMGVDAREGFYQVVWMGRESVFRRVDKTFEQSTTAANDGTIGYFDPNYKYGLFEFFRYNEEYTFLDADGNLSKLKNRSSLLRHLGQKKSAVRKYVKDNGYDNLRDFGEYCKVVMKYAEGAE